MRPPRKRPGSARGFTLLELMVATSVLAVVILVLTLILISSGRAESKTAGRAQAQASCRDALTLMATELRQAGLDPGVPPAGVVGIVAGDSVSIRVRADLNGNGVIETAEPSEDVTYAWDPGARTITRNPGAGPAVMLDRVSAFSLSYFDAANQPLAALPLDATEAAAVHSIGLTFTSTGADAQPITLATRITLRNQ